MSQLLKYMVENEPQFRRARLASLYSDFRHLGTANPDGYAANVKAWQSALARAARDGRLPDTTGGRSFFVIHTGEELLQALESNEWGRPLALGAVIKEAIISKELLSLHTFMVSPEPVYHSSWRGTPWQLVVWGLRQLGLSGGAAGEDRLAVGQFIILTNIQDFARKITLAASTFDRIERIFSKESFKKYIQKMLGDSVPPSDLDVEVLLIYLTRDAKAIAYDGKTIRFRSSDQASATITNQDESIASLKTVIADHEAQLATLTERIEQLNMSARESLARKNRISATAAIRSRKVAEKALSERSLALSQLEEVFNNVLRASNQVEVMRVMESSTDVLKSLHKEVGGAERVKDVVDQLQEEMSKVSEVEDLIGNVGDANMTIDQADVDEELEAIAQEQKKSSERLRDADVAEGLSRIDDDPGRRRIQNKGDANLDDVEKEILARSAELGRISLDESSRPIPERHKSKDTVHAIPAS